MATARVARLRAPRLLTVPVVFAAVCATLVGPIASSSASPQLSLSQVEARISALNVQAEKITEAYDGARDDLAALQRETKAASDQLSRDQAALARSRAGIDQQADLAYRTGGLDQLVTLVTSSSPQTFIDQTAMLDEISRFQADQLDQAGAARHQVEAAKADFSARSAAAAKVLAGISRDKAHIQALLAGEQRLLDSLRAADRDRLAAERNAAASDEAALRGSYTGPASGRAAAAVQFAYNQLGKPYVYGASGPDSYDCSGLTMRSWQAAGVSLPHNAAAQQGETRSVSMSDLQPGDLVFFGDPAYHVAIYVGGGNVIQAPHTGDVVRITPLSQMPDYSGAGRP